MRAGKLEAADSITSKITQLISRSVTTNLVRSGGMGDSKDMWMEVKRLIGKGSAKHASEVTAQELNKHYAAISNNKNFSPIDLKLTAAPDASITISEQSVFHFLEHQKTTATGPDTIPSWFLKLGAPIFSSTIAQLYNLSLQTSIVPNQWKVACIHPIPKISPPKSPSDYRPISITCILSRILERIVVKTHLFPLFSPSVNALSNTMIFHITLITGPQNPQPLLSFLSCKL